MTVEYALGIIFIFGIIGGMVNALMTDNGFVLPRKEESGGVEIIRPGFLVNLLIGGVAACLSWGLYGPYTELGLLMSDDAVKAAMDAGVLPSKIDPIIIKLSSAMGAVLIGIGGSRWITDQVDKKLLQAAATEAANSSGNAELASKISSANPAEAFRVASTK